MIQYVAFNCLLIILRVLLKNDFDDVFNSSAFCESIPIFDGIDTLNSLQNALLA